MPDHTQFTDEITRFGYKYRLETQYDIRKTDVKKRVQVRDAHNYAPIENVRTYAQQMSRNAKAFPPLVMTRDNWIVDGNTRIGALHELGQNFSPALMIEVDYESLNAKQKAELHALAATFNQMGGQRLTRAEMLTVATELVKFEWTNERIAEAIGASASVVTSIRKAINGEKRLAKIGLNPASFNDRGLKGLGHNDAIALNDEPFKAVAELQQAAGLNTGEVITLVKELKELGSDEEKLTRIADARSESGSRIHEHSVTGNGKPSASALLRRSLGFTVKFEGKEKELVEQDAGAQLAHTNMLKAAIDILQAVLKLQPKPKERVEVKAPKASRLRPARSAQPQAGA